MTEVRSQRSDDRGQISEDRGQISEDRRQKTEDRCQNISISHIVCDWTLSSDFSI
jgi:hypothetical protein